MSDIDWRAVAIKAEGLAERFKTRLDRALESQKRTRSELGQAYSELDLARTELETERAWINEAVRSCAKKGCATMERRLKTAEDALESMIQERDRPRGHVATLRKEPYRHVRSEREAILEEIDRAREGRE